MMKVFYVSRKNKINALISMAITLGIFVYVVYLFFQLAGDFTGKSEEVFFMALVTFGMLMLAVFSFWIELYAVVSWDARLILDGHRVELITNKWARYLPWYGLESFSVAYEQIQSITVSPFFRKATITGHDAKTYIFLPTWFGDDFGEAVLLALQSRVPQGVFSPDIDVPVAAKRWAKLDRLRSAVSILLMCWTLFSMVFNPRDSLFVHSWHVENPKLFNEYVRFHSVDEEGGFWAAGWGFDGYTLYYLPGENKWTLPEDQYGESYPQFVSGDPNGFPIVWMDTGAFHYEIDDWRFIPYENSLDVNMDFFDSRGVASGTKCLMIESQKNQIVEIDALTGKWSVIHLPEDVNQQDALPISMRRASNGDILVLIVDNPAASVYVLSDGEWMLQKYPVSMPGGFVKDYSLDNDGSLWVLLADYRYFAVEKIDLNGNASKTQLPFQDDVYVDQLIVDGLERLWVTERFSDVLTVFNPVWDGTAVEVVQYTEHNSNYQGGDLHYLEISPDGRVWSFGKNIITMDATVNKLPSPWPAWYASLNFEMIKIFLALSFLGWELYFVWAFRK
ncbi:MAG TPA: hypothetical protein PLI15_16485 [Anaerolineales bacterium]|nr:hypothetical protein [Anaerolineales bacterium]